MNFTNVFEKFHIPEHQQYPIPFIHLLFPLSSKQTPHLLLADIHVDLTLGSFVVSLSLLHLS